jgi:RNA polymerase sigma-70 factor (ECF subfamily)
MERLFKSWYARLVASARRRLDNVDDAEDVAQEAFVRLLDEEPADAPAWLFTVAGRLATDRQRMTRRRDRITAQRALELEPSSAGDSAEHRMERAETIRAVRATLEALPRRDRVLLLMHHDGVPYREIAARLGLSTSSIGSLLTRAHRRFLAAYDPGSRAQDEDQRA